MRQVYIELIKALASAAESGVDANGIAELLVLLNSEEAPDRDQDIIDFMSELYIFTIFGYEPERLNQSDVIKSWEDCWRRIAALEQPSR